MASTTRGVTGRLAPTPSGELHLGNALAFAAAWLSVRRQQGTLLLRVEDVDKTRARQHVADGQRRDLEWLGLTWDRETPAQSVRDYRPFLAALAGHTYFDPRTRRELAEATDPYLVRSLGLYHGAVRFIVDGVEHFVDRRFGPQSVDTVPFADPVLQRRDGVFTYALAVTADDIVDGVTEVVRGRDLLDYTAAQLPLWRAFGATPPSYLHAPLVLGPDGRKLGKSHGSTSIASLREGGWEAADVWRVVLPWLGCEADSLDAALPQFTDRGSVGAQIQLEAEPDTPETTRWLARDA